MNTSMNITATGDYRLISDAGKYLISGSKDGVYYDYIDTGLMYPTDEELLERMDIKTIEKFLRKKKMQNIKNESK